MLTNDDGEPRCVFEPMNEYMDCAMLWPTTTTTTDAPGCCYGSSYKAQAKCLGLDRDMCARKGCEFLETENEDDCILTTTESPTTTVIPGCCKGTSCTFIAFGVIEEDCQFPVTAPPEDPGCCYGNPDIAYSKRWMDSCKTFGTEAECTMLTNDDGEPRCVFEPLGEYMDCETVWPTTTTTTETPGCCYGDSYKAQDKCLGLDADMCARKGCNFLETDDPNDCVLTTETPTTTKTVTEEPGCCKADSVKREDMCE